MGLTVWAGATISALFFLIPSMVAGRSEETIVEAVPWHHNHPAEQASAPAIKAGPEDEAAIRKIVAEGTDAWNRRDAKAMTAHTSEDHDHINVNGAWRNGRAETEKALSAALATRRIDAITSVAKIRFLTPDVAIVVVRYEYSNDKKNWNSIATSVFHKISGTWWNEAFQNTLVTPPEGRADVVGRENPTAPEQPEVETPTNSERASASEDEAAIRKIVAEGTDAWNRRDAKALAAHISEDHNQIGVYGGWSSGRAQFEKALTAALATTRNNISRSIAKIRFLTPDVAIVVIRNEYTNDKETRKSISTSVFHKIDGIWWNEAFQNTYVQPPLLGLVPAHSNFTKCTTGSHGSGLTGYDCGGGGRCLALQGVMGASLALNM